MLMCKRSCSVVLGELTLGEVRISLNYFAIAENKGLWVVNSKILT